MNFCEHHAHGQQYGENWTRGRRNLLRNPYGGETVSKTTRASSSPLSFGTGSIVASDEVAICYAPVRRSRGPLEQMWMTVLVHLQHTSQKSGSTKYRFGC